MAENLPIFHPITQDHGDIAEYRKRNVALITGITGQDGSYLLVSRFTALSPRILLNTKLTDLLMN